MNKGCSTRVFLLLMVFLLSCTGQLKENGTGLMDAEVSPRSVIQDVFTAEGIQPLILLTAKLSEEQATTNLRTPYFYHGLFASETSFNVQDYLTHNSAGKYTISFQGVWGPYQLETADSISEIFESAMSQHELEGHDFTQFDANKDGRLTGDELMVVVVDNGTMYGGAVRNANFNLPSGLKVRMQAAILGSQINLATAAHEVVHLLGAVDIYGSNCNNLGLSLMSCTGYDRFGDDTVHLDPWHKMNLGWIEPRFVNVQTSQAFYQCHDLEVPQYRGTESTFEQRPLLVYDAERSPNEYLLIEFRNGYFEYPGYHSYESVPGMGVVIWSVRVDEATGLPLIVPSLISFNAWDATIWTYGTNRSVQPLPFLEFGMDFENTIFFLPPFFDDRSQRSPNFWGPGTLVPTWQDGTHTGFLIDIGDFDFYSSIVRVCLFQEGDVVPN